MPLRYVHFTVCKSLFTHRLVSSLSSFLCDSQACLRVVPISWMGKLRLGTVTWLANKL